MFLVPATRACILQGMTGILVDHVEAHSGLEIFYFIIFNFIVLCYSFNRIQTLFQRIKTKICVRFCIVLIGHYCNKFNQSLQHVQTECYLYLLHVLVSRISGVWHDKYLMQTQYHLTQYTITLCFYVILHYYCYVTLFAIIFLPNFHIDVDYLL